MSRKFNVGRQNDLLLNEKMHSLYTHLEFITYKDGDGNEVYGITETEYVSPASTKLCITNSYGFTSLTGWQGG